MECEKFWLEKPVELVNNFDILPEKSMCMDSKLNAATRLALIISLVLFFSKIDKWQYFLVGSIVFIIVLKYIVYKPKKENFKPCFKALNPIGYNSQSTPIEAIDRACDMVEYYDDEYEPKSAFGVSKLMPDEEGIDYNMDRNQLQFLNTNKYAERIVESRNATSMYFVQAMNERFADDEYDVFY